MINNFIVSPSLGFSKLYQPSKIQFPMSLSPGAYCTELTFCSLKQLLQEGIWWSLHKNPVLGAQKLGIIGTVRPCNFQFLAGFNLVQVRIDEKSLYFDHYLLFG